MPRSPRPKEGAWTWLTPTTLQFRPTAPWQPLRRETVTVGGTATDLVPLLPVPSASGTSDGSNADTFALQFDQPVDLAALDRLITIEVTPPSGLGKETLKSGDFVLKPVERAGTGAAQTVLVVLQQPLQEGYQATLKLRLSDQPGYDDPIFETALQAAKPFKLSDTYCGDSYNHSTTDGVTVCDPASSEPAKPRVAVLQFNATPETLDIVRARDVLRITPPLDGLTVSAGGENELRIGGKFDTAHTYEIKIEAGTLKDSDGRALATAVDAHVSFNAGSPALAWDVRQGIVERLGPQYVPLRGHGYDRADVRVYAIDPLSRDFWPFPRGGLTTSDGRAPPLPGNEPRHYVQAGPISGDAMAQRITALGSPAASELMELPIRRGGIDAKFGLDLGPVLAKVAGPRAPGTYLVGVRAVDSDARQWARLQVTDLSLTGVEEADRVHFAVTSLSSAQPVAGAEIHLDGLRDGRFVTLAQGTTAADGSWTMPAPLARGRNGYDAAIGRITVTKATDTLVIEPGRGPQVYADGRWSKPETPWLDWTTSDVADRRPAPQTLCRVFTERPIYRPEEPVLIAGMIRRYDRGALAYAGGTGEVIVTAPGDQTWHLPVTLDDVGGFHIKFDAKTEATGDYSIQYQPKDGQPCGALTVKKEAYRLPTFEVVLHGPDKTPLDAPFSVDLLARFFAGGLLSDRPITWRVTQTPYIWTPPGRDGFLFSSDSRFSGDTTFRSTPVLNREAKTDAGGSAQLTLDPTIEPTAQPRQYLVEATVTGDDDLQVRGVQRVTALPPFVLGVKVPRYVDHLGALDPEVVALDGEGHEIAGLAMTVKLIHRQWNSVLEASDFAQGSAKYQTQVLDETAAERHGDQHGHAAAGAFRRERGRRLPRGGDRRGQGRPHADGAGGPVHGRGHAGDLAAPAGRDRHRQHGQGQIRPRRDRDTGDPEPVPDRPRPGRGGGAGGPVPLRLGRYHQRLRPLHRAGAQAADAAFGRPLPGHAGAAGRSGGRQRAVRPGQADHAGGHQVGHGDGRRQPRRRHVRRTRRGPPGAGVRPGGALGRRARPPRARRGDGVDGGSGRALAGQGGAAGPAARLHRQPPEHDGRTRHAQHGVRRHPAAGDARRRRERRFRHGEHLRAQELHPRAAVCAAGEVRGGWHGAGAREAAGFADGIHAASRGDRRAGPVRFRYRADAHPPTDRGATRLAPLRAAG